MHKIPKILIIEDNPNASQTIAMSLEGLGKCVIAESGEEALKKIRNKNNHFDVIILDLMLPGIDGLETLKKAKDIKHILPPIIVLTGDTDHTIKNAFASGKLGVFKYLTKDPFKDTKLKNAVTKALNKKLRFKPCFKHKGTDCLYSIPIQDDFVFVGMPFAIKDIYEHGIKPTVESFKLKCWRADEDNQTGDMACKICASLQACKFVIMEISEENVNVGIEIGLAYSYGKKVILLRKSGSPGPVSDLLSIEYAGYSDLNSLKKALAKYIKPILQ